MAFVFPDHICHLSAAEIYVKEMLVRSVSVGFNGKELVYVCVCACVCVCVCKM